MLESLQSIDPYLFHLINGWHPAVWIETLFVYWRTKTTWVPLYLIFAVWIIYKYRLKGIWLLLWVIIAVTLADQISSHILKPWIARMRPCQVPLDGLLLRVQCGSGWSFPSAHATDHFALVGFFSFIRKTHNRSVFLPLVVWATLVALAQVFVGVHYPSDILFGALLGLGIGRLIYWMYLRTKLRILF